MQRKGRYPPPHGASNIIGLEASGEIVLVGNQATKDWTIGNKVSHETWMI
jgi:NADPH:quinone reductase